MYQEYKDRAEFLFVYIREAHPADGWQMDNNVKDDVVFERPKTMDARKSIAKACGRRLKLSMPTVVDRLDNRVDTLYAAWPERIYVVAADGTIAYAGLRGPWGFKPGDAEKTLRRLLKNQ